MPERHPLAAELETTYRRIHTERMDGIPILNPRLEVESVGVRDWNGSWLSVLVTPWFINLMLLPGTPEQAAAWKALKLGSAVVHPFPAGRFEFLIGEEPSLGRYQMCSLFSPVLEFESHEAARIAAEASLEALFDAALDPAAEAKAKEDAERAEAARAHVPSTPSRRGFLFGRATRPPEGQAS